MITPSLSTEHPGWEPSNAVALNHHVPRLMADTFEEPGLDPVDIGEGSDWNHFPHHSTAAFRLHSLTFLNTLTETYRETGELRYARKARELALRWLAARGEPDDSPAWHGHATALRTGMLAYLYDAGFAADESVLASLRAHAQHLSLEENYEGAWNHGLDQNIALLRASRALGEARFGTVAASRLDEAAGEYVDPQGVVSEQAAHYAVYVHKQLGTAIEELRLTGLRVSEKLRRRDRIPAFLTWATRPDGYLVQIGDSMLRQPPGDVAADLSFSTGMESGAPPPPGRHMTYDDGWAFIRSGWGETRPSSEESHLTVRFGTFRRIHGHRDHTSVLWFAGGRPILEDPGFSGYGNKAIRVHELSEMAHSTVFLTGAGGFEWSRGTDLRQHSVLSGPGPDHELHLLHLVGEPYPGITRTRSIAYLPQLGVLLVRDAIKAPTTVRAHQNWQFGAGLRDFARSEDGMGAVLSDDHGRVHVRQYLTVDELAAYHGSDDPIAGWSPTLASARTPSWCLRWARRGEQIGFLTSMTTRDDLQVDLASGGRLKVTLEELGSEPLATLRFDVETGFQAVALPPTGRWDHRPR